MTSPELDRLPLGESRMLGEYLAREYGDATVFMRLRLGTIEPAGQYPDLSPSERGIFRALARYADAIAVRPSELVIIEAKMRAEPDAISQLELYALLAPQTPELQPFLDRPLVMELVVAVPDPVVQLLADRRGVRVRHHAPAWLPRWSATQNARKRGAPRGGGLVPE